ncbi:MAG TPA: EAL domain-containing protein, partial [Solirubrobacteraceae bacterium]|nr:EAL domain-containing protein [Solirubrobacteraceae bacterium]
VIELGHALKLSVTAEGVETTDQLGNLQNAGCDTAQGFLFYRPEPPEVIEQLFAAGHASGESRPARPVVADRGGAARRRRRLARRSLVAGFRAMTHAWVNGAGGT